MLQAHFGNFLEGEVLQLRYVINLFFTKRNSSIFEINTQTS